VTYIGLHAFHRNTDIHEASQRWAGEHPTLNLQRRIMS
jgi:hypothetical protein